jgi:hypothetical protein
MRDEFDYASRRIDNLRISTSPFAFLFPVEHLNCELPLGRGTTLGFRRRISLTR